MSADGKKAVEVFAGELNRLRVLSGMPSLMRLVELSNDLAFPLARATISDKLTAKSPPRWEFVVSFVAACREYAGRTGATPPSQMFDLDWWDAAYWQMLAACDATVQDRRLLWMARRRLADTRQPPIEPVHVPTASSTQPRTEAATSRLPPATPPPAAVAAAVAVPSVTGVPAQLPPKVGHFTGRQAELSILDNLGEGVVVISGPGGMGKTALAVQWAHQAIDRFPDGQFFLDLRGHDPATSMPVAEVLSHLLTALGVQAESVAADTSAQLGFYRSAVRGRRILIVLDNTASADQVTSLVPPGSASLLVVTSRRQLTALALDHAVTAIELDMLTRRDASTLLQRVLGRDRVVREQTDADRLVELCGRMPLALRIAAAKLVTRRMRPLADLVTEMTGQDRLGALAVPGDSHSIRTVFASAYQSLNPLTATLFRRLGSNPGATFSVHLAQAMAGVPVHQSLDVLAVAHLMSEVDSDRFRFHDLIRLYAIECATPSERSQANFTIILWYLRLAEIANRLLEPARDRVKLDWDGTAPDMTFLAGTESVLTFLDAERANLLPIVRHAAQHGHRQLAWQLTYLLTSYYTHRGYRSDYTEMCYEGLAAALHLSDPVAECLMRGALGVALNVMHRHEEALQQLTVARDMMRTAGDKWGEGMALNNIAHAYAQLHRLEEAKQTLNQALHLHTDAGHTPGIALALSNIADVYTELGDVDKAYTCLEKALRLAREIGNPHLEGAVQQNLGETSLATGEQDRALAHFSQALQIRQRVGEKRREAETSNAIGLVHLSRHDHTTASDHFRRALTLAHDIQDHTLEATTLAHISGLTRPPTTRV